MPDKAVAQPTRCPPSCCNGTELLCISIPCPINIVLLGALNLTLNLPCLTLTSTGPLTGAQANQLLGILGTLLGALGGVIPNA